MTREEVLQYAKEQYGTDPDYPWRRDRESAVLRHADSRRWYGLLMRVGKDRLGLPGGESVDILNVKCDPMLGEALRGGPGIFPAYHMNHAEWISILLDGTVEGKRVLDLLDLSYRLTASRKEKNQARGPKEWIIPANYRYYNVEEGLAESPVMEWKQSSDVRVGDTVYLYMGAPISAILYKFKAIEVNIPYQYEDSHLTIRRAMKLELMERYDKDRFPLRLLKSFGVYAVRSPRSMPHSLSCEINGPGEAGLP